MAHLIGDVHHHTRNWAHLKGMVYTQKESHFMGIAHKWKIAQYLTRIVAHFHMLNLTGIAYYHVEFYGG